MPKADITSPKLTFASEDTALEVDQPNVVPSISVEEVEKPVIEDERKGEKKDSKKNDDQTVRFTLTNLIQMWRQTLNQNAFRRTHTVKLELYLIILGCCKAV
ncbi:hypothetical protein T09_7421 [Trichinella sp. T9]|nr:hypothetical protein T09_7421 [Trichinella sp. T9]